MVDWLFGCLVVCLVGRLVGSWVVCLVGWLVGGLVVRLFVWLVGLLDCWLDDPLKITITGEGLQNVEIKSACIAFEGGTLVFAVSSERNKGRCPIAVSNAPPPFLGHQIHFCSQNVLH